MLSQIENKIIELESTFGVDNLEDLRRITRRFLKKEEEVTYHQWLNKVLIDVIGFTSEEEPYWTFVAANLFLDRMYKESTTIRKTNEAYKGFYELLKMGVREKLYQEKLLTAYTEDEVIAISKMIDKKKDELFTYIGLRTFYDRYLLRTHKNEILELPQERFMVIAMTLMQNETENRLNKIKEAYWAMSNLYMTVATPTMSNAGKTHGQLSSCFIDTVDDSLQGIYDSNTDIANLSKFGGGIGVYMGKVRSRGSSIRGFSNISSGVLPWIKQLNNTAVSVDQLGQRQGAIAVYLDVWHKDVFSFLDLRLNNGDERLRAHDIFTGLCLPDIFMEAVKARGDWYLFDPHEVRNVMGFNLEDFYDEEKGKGSFREHYQKCVNEPMLSKEKVSAIEIMKRIMRSQLETGVPFMFYRDEANRKNPNKHAGMIYSSNLCTEIFQNGSPTIFVESKVNEEGYMVTVKKPGDLVVCNLSSINLGKAVIDNVLERLITIEVRMLDNTIDVNELPLTQAKITNQKYRAIGLGTFGWHHLLALKGIKWESEEAVNLADSLYEDIAYFTIKASSELAQEKGSYSMFEGSDWENGKYFESREYTSERWVALKEDVAANGMRNGYTMAIAPNSTTAIIAGSTASIDPIFQKSYSEEKKDYKIPVTAPDLNNETTWLYKSAYFIDQLWSIKQNAKRSKHIDQGISFNLYVQNTVKAKDLLNFHMTAWHLGLKSTYYVRSTSVELMECSSCES